YYSYSRHREFAYLKSFILGVDIDGVLNLHRQQFSTFLEKLSGKVIDSDKISALPVRDAGLGVTRDDEHLVFNEPQYWVDMPAIADASEELDRLRNQFKPKVYIFTHRPWPDPEIKGQTEFVQRWRKAALESLEKLERGSDSGKVGLRTRARTEISRLRVKLSGRRYGLRLIDVITECWLVSNK